MFKKIRTFVLFATALVVCGGLLLFVFDRDDRLEQSTALPFEAEGLTTEPELSGIDQANRTENENNLSREKSRIQELLSGNQFEQAVKFFDQLYSRLNNDDIDHIRDLFLRRANQLMASDQNQAASRLLLIYGSSNDDLEIWDLLVRSASKIPDWELALNAALRSSALEHRPQELVDGLERLMRISLYLRSDLEKKNDLIGILSLYQRLYEQHPGYPRFQLELARAQISMGEFEGARNHLDILQYDPDFGQLAQQMLAAISPDINNDIANVPKPSRGEIVVPLIRNGDSFLINVQVNTHRLRLLLDTGASITALSQKAVRALGLEATNRHITLNTANGQRRSQLYRAEKFSIGGLTQNNVIVAEIEFGNSSNIQGLLGTDLLNQIDQQYSYLLDNQNNVLTFRRK